MPGPINQFTERTFRRVDANNDRRITKSEVKEHLSDVGVGGGFFGRIIQGKAADAFLDEFDSNRSGSVTWEEFQGQASALMPQEILDAGGAIDRDLAAAEFAKMDRNNSGSVSVRELQSHLLRELPSNTSHRETVAEVGAKLGVDALDENRNGAVEREEFDGALTHLDELNR